MASSTGVAYAWFDPKKPATFQNLERLYLGQWDLSCGPYESGALRFVRFRQFLHVLNPSIVFYEAVRYTPPAGLNMKTIGQVMARAYPTAEFIGALKGVLSGYCEEQNIPCCGLDIGAIKKFATGRGNANKEQMIAAANEAYGASLEIEGYETSGTDNIADAVHLLMLGLTQHSAGVPA